MMLVLGDGDVSIQGMMMMIIDKSWVAEAKKTDKCDVLC